MKLPLSLWLSGILLAGAVVLLMLPPKYEAYYTPDKNLKEWLPQAPGGWTTTDRPIADTPEVKEAVAELLNFTDGVFRIYEKGNRQLAVYIAYWEPGKMDPRLVAVHSPDVCWIGAGWKRTGSAGRWDPKTPAGHGLGPGELRTFEANGQAQNVIFWHLVGGLPSGFMGRSAANGSFWSWDKIIKSPRAPRHEQWFVRISTSGKLSDFEDDPLWLGLLEKLSLLSKG